MHFYDFHPKLGKYFKTEKPLSLIEAEFLILKWCVRKQLVEGELVDFGRYPELVQLIGNHRHWSAFHLLQPFEKYLIPVKEKT